ncbi:YodC family protein [Oharaeibacter diazotrophicus]|nr:DUF2158 domain-containing protein [Oharaeibacter diazotrophicus]GLS75736.1 hypothetical protein GCM10007904_10710 [Oharaeibacter diazotrophicus]
MSQKFNAGDIVQLKSGGPAMTVERPDIYDEGSYICVWFKGSSREMASFRADVLIMSAPLKD